MKSVTVALISNDYKCVATIHETPSAITGQHLQNQLNEAGPLVTAVTDNDPDRVKITVGE